MLSFVSAGGQVAHLKPIDLPYDYSHVVADIRPCLFGALTSLCVLSRIVAQSGRINDIS